MIAPDLLRSLRCPENHQPLSVADSDLVNELNRSIADGRLKNRADRPVIEPIDGGLIRSDRRLLYPIRNTIPILILDEAIPLPP